MGIDEYKIINCNKCGYNGKMLCNATFDGYICNCPECDAELIKPL
jgi:phage FluMu protein Com